MAAFAHTLTMMVSLSERQRAGSATFFLFLSFRQTELAKYAYLNGGYGRGYFECQIYLGASCDHTWRIHRGQHLGR